MCSFLGKATCCTNHSKCPRHWAYAQKPSQLVTLWIHVCTNFLLCKNKQMHWFSLCLNANQSIYEHIGSLHYNYVEMGL